MAVFILDLLAGPPGNRTMDLQAADEHDSCVLAEHLTSAIRSPNCLYFTVLYQSAMSTHLIHLIVTLLSLHLDCYPQTNYAFLTHEFIIYMNIHIGVSLVLMTNFIIPKLLG